MQIKAFLVSLVVLFLLAKPVFAVCPDYPALSTCNLERITTTNVNTLRNLIVGASKDKISQQSSAVGFFVSGIGLMASSPPVSTSDYLSYMGQKFHVPGTPLPAYADTGGLGYNTLTPVLKIWTVVRNLAYLVFAIIFIVIGLMILIRAKIDPKTTINIQNALPKIILALILVTFSYAIAGFLIDLMYVAIALILTVIKSMGFDKAATSVEANVLSNQTVFHFFVQGEMFGIITGAASAIGNIVDTLLGQGYGGAVVGFITSGLAALIIAIAILWALFKTWLSLLSAYANIILGIIFSPIQLMADAIPGQNQFEGWIRTMLSNLMAFPAVIAMMFLSTALATNFGQGIPSEAAASGFVPPLIGGNSQIAMQSLIGLAILLTIPKTVEMLQEVLKAPKQKFGSAWGEAVNFAYGQTAKPWVDDSRAAFGARGEYNRRSIILGATGLWNRVTGGGINPLARAAGATQARARQYEQGKLGGKGPNSLVP